MHYGGLAVGTSCLRAYIVGICFAGFSDTAISPVAFSGHNFIISGFYLEAHVSYVWVGNHMYLQYLRIVALMCNPAFLRCQLETHPCPGTEERHGPPMLVLLGLINRGQLNLETVKKMYGRSHAYKSYILTQPTLLFRP